LRHALRAFSAAGHGTHGVGAEPAFLPDHTGEKLERQTMIARRGFDHQADGIIGCGRLRGC
jgi:hypothetical protein